VSPVTPVSTADTTTSAVAGSDSAYWQIASNSGGTGYNDIWFTDTLHGFAAGLDGFIYVSVDGGTSWNKAGQLETGPPNAGLQTLFFPTPDVGYAIGGVHFAVTTNGGQSWTTKPRPDPMTNSSYKWPNLQFLTAATGYLATGIGLYRTDDTGTVWTPVERDSVGALSFSNSGNGFIFSSPDKISHTADGGASWVSTATLPNSSAGSTFTYLQFSGDQLGWFTDFQRLSVTVNGGAGWKSVFRSASSDPILDFQALTGQTVYLATNRRLYKSVDGGVSWAREYTLPASVAANFGLSALYFTDDHHGWACGGNGVVLRFRH
jgi:photosystem II stability/assembly factor-like uncharacterized protein